MGTFSTFLLYSMLTCGALGIALALKMMWCAWRKHKRENEDMRRHVRRVA